MKCRSGPLRRGLRGRSGGGLRYGCDVVTSLDAAGELVRGGRTINEGEAEVVRRVFGEFASGVSPPTIASRLNAENIPCRSGKLWTDASRIADVIRYAGHPGE